MILIFMAHVLHCTTLITPSDRKYTSYVQASSLCVRGSRVEWRCGLGFDDGTSLPPIQSCNRLLQIFFLSFFDCYSDLFLRCLSVLCILFNIFTPKKIRHMHLHIRSTYYTELYLAVQYAYATRPECLHAVVGYFGSGYEASGEVCTYTCSGEGMHLYM